MYMILYCINFSQMQQKKQYKKGFICTKNNYQLVCQFQPLCSKLVLVLFIQISSKLTSHSSAHPYYFSKSYSEYQCNFSTDPFSMIFQTLQEFYLHLLKNKQLDTLNLHQGYIQIELELFNKKVTKTLQLQKIIHSRIERYLLKTKKIVDKKLRQEMDKNSVLLQKLEKATQQFQISQKQYLITIQKANRQTQILSIETNQLRARLQLFQQIYQQQKRHYQTKISYLENLLLQQEQQYNRNINRQNRQYQAQEEQNHLQEENAISIIKNEQIQRQKENVESVKQNQEKIVIQVQEQKKQQEQQEQSIKQEQYHIDKYINKYLQEQMKDLKNGKKSKLKLDLSGNIPCLCIKFCKDINFVIQTLKVIQQMNFNNLISLNLQKNNICDDGWQCLIKINLPKLNQLSASNNNLKNITFNTESIQNLSCLCLSDNKKMGSYPNTLTQSTLKKLLNCKWQNLKQLSIDFKCYNQVNQLKENFELWNTFIDDKFGSFPQLQSLYYGTCHISNQTILKLRNICNQLSPKKILLFDHYKQI